MKSFYQMYERVCVCVCVRVCVWCLVEWRLVEWSGVFIEVLKQCGLNRAVNDTADRVWALFLYNSQRTRC